MRGAARFMEFKAWETLLQPSPAWAWDRRLLASWDGTVSKGSESRRGMSWGVRVWSGNGGTGVILEAKGEKGPQKWRGRGI